MSDPLEFVRADDDTYVISLRSRQIGDILPCRRGGWVGRIRVNEQEPIHIADTAQSVVDALDAWYAAGQPPDAELLKGSQKKRRIADQAAMNAALRRFISRGHGNDA